MNGNINYEEIIFLSAIFIPYRVYENISNIDSATIFRYKASIRLNYAIGGNLLCIKKIFNRACICIFRDCLLQ